MVGETLQSLERQSEALSYLEEAASLFAQLKDSQNEALMWRKVGSVLNTLGIAEWKERNFQKALQHYKRGLVTFRKLKDDVHAGLMLNSIGVTLKSLKRTEDAIAVLEEAVKTNQETGEKLLEAYALAALGEIHGEIGENDQAFEYYNGSLQIRKEIDDRSGEGWMLYHVARLSSLRRNLDESRKFLEQSKKIGEGLQDQKLLVACKGLEEALNK
jgi:tetratricopeptide (TPR) repeat protein